MEEAHNINLLEEINSVSKIHTLNREDIDNIMTEFAQRILVTLKIERMSVWLFGPDGDHIESMGEYDIEKKKLSKGSVIEKKKCPNYLKAVGENEILLVENVRQDERTNELNDFYSIPFNVISLMDVPLRIAGEFIGIMCFEKTGSVQRKFSANEQTFALYLATVFASNLEARHRRALQSTLSEALKEKDILLREIHHRVKNNISVISSLLSLQSSNARDAYHRNLFLEARNRLFAISEVHELIYSAKSFSDINIKAYISQLLENLSKFYSEKQVKMTYQLDMISTKVDLALPLALVTNEVVTNCYKHAFKEIVQSEIYVSLKRSNNALELYVRDNGPGFDMDRASGNSLGLEIIKGLATQIDSHFEYLNDSGTVFKMEVPLREDHK